MPDVGYYTLPVILSFEGVDKQVNSKLGKAFDGIAKKAGKNVGTGVSAGLKSTEADVKKAADAYSKFRDKAEDSIGKVRVAEAALTKARSSGNDARTVAAEERLATARRNSTRAVNEAQTAHRALEGAQRSLAGGTDNLKSKFGGLDDIAGKAKTAIMGAGVIAAGAAVVGIAALAAGVVVAGNALYDLGAQFDDVFDNIRIKTGATGGELDGLKNRVKAIAPNVAVPLEQVGDAVAEVTRHLHLSGTELDNVARSLLDFGRLTGEQIDVKKLGQVFRGFNVQGKDQVKVMDSLFRTWQKTGIPVNDLLTTMVKFGGTLRNINPDLGVAVGLVASFEEAGLDADVAVKGLQKSVTYFSDQQVDVNKGLEDTFTSIKNLSEADAINLANKVFGPKGGQNFVDAVRSGRLDLDALKGLVKTSGDTIAGAAADTDDWAENWKKLKNTVSVGLEPIGTAVFDTVNVQLEKLSTWISTHQDEAIRFFGRIGDAAITGLQAIIRFGADGLRAIADMVRSMSSSLKPFFDDMARIGSVLQFVPGFQAIGTQMKQLGEAGQQISTGLDKVPGILEQGANKLDGLNTKLGEGRTWWDAIITRTADAQKLVQGLGDATAAIDTDKTITLSSNAPEVVEGMRQLGIRVETLPDGRITIVPDTEEGERLIQAWRDQQEGKPIEPPVDPDFTGADKKMRSFIDEWNAAIIAPPVQPQTPSGTPPMPTFPPRPRAYGGGIYGVGGPTQDNIPIWASVGEHMLDAGDVKAMGGQGAVYEFRRNLHRATGGGITLLDIIKLGNVPMDPDSKYGPYDPKWGKSRRKPVLWPHEGPYTGGAGPGSAGSGGLPPGWQPNPDDFLFPDFLPPGYPWKEWAPGGKRKRIKMLSGGGDVGGGSSGYGPINPFIAWPIAQIFKQIGRRWDQTQHGSFEDILFGGRYGFAGGGAIDAITAAATVSGSPYNWGSIGNDGQFDCSGYQSYIYGILTGRGTGSRHFDTSSDFEALGFKRGYLPGAYNIGVHRGSSDRDSHMAGTLPNGVNVEAGGSVGDAAIYGDGAAGANAPNLELHYYLPLDSMVGGDPRRGNYGYDQLLSGGAGGGAGGGNAASVAAAQNNVTEARGSLAEAQARERELPADAKESERIAAHNAVVTATNNLSESETALAEEMNNSAKATGDAAKQVKIDPQLQQLGELPGLLVNGLFESLGIGDIFPDFTKTPAWKSFAGGISAFKGPIQGLVEGKLGIQQPGWQPGMPIPGSGDTGTGVSGGGGIPLPFGLPNIELPPPPLPAEHAGTGAPPGPVMQNNDMSVTFQGNVGMGPTEINRMNDKHFDKGIAKIGGVPVAAGN